MSRSAGEGRAELKPIQRLAVAIGPWIVRALALTWKIDIKDSHHWRDRKRGGEASILSLWHGEMLPLLYVHRGQGIAILISEHRDGEVIARIAERLGLRTIRGSSSRGAARALISMGSALAEGTDIAITPDGPRGPLHSVAPGVLVVANRSRVPIVPLRATANRYWQLNSWDQFIIPKPFTKVSVAYGDPIFETSPNSRAAAENSQVLSDGMQQAGGKSLAGLRTNFRLEKLWYMPGLQSRVARVLLWPFSLLYTVGTAVRNFGFNSQILKTHKSPVFTVSIGNLSVGGTGKTPIASAIAAKMAQDGKRPAIVMRGYGDDEPLVHQYLNPDIPVIVNSDRVAGVKEALAQGADSIILDDAFQHRRISRNLDVVVLSAEQWGESGGAPLVLPAGPLREGWSGIKRADLVIISRRSANDKRVNEIKSFLQKNGIRVPVLVAELGIGELRRADRNENAPRSIPKETLEGESVAAISGIGDPESFYRQLKSWGAEVHEYTFRDHHLYSNKDLLLLQKVARNHKYTVTTLKDAVKLAPRWPANGANLWYVSQTVKFTSDRAVENTVISNIFTLGEP